MGLDTIVWISVALFLVHEFEEIIMIRPWLVRYQHDPRARKQVFWSFHETSTSVIAAMIFEEYILVAVIAFTATAFDLPGMFAGFMIPYTLHLISHIVEAIRLRMRTPSVLSSLITLPWCLYAIVATSIHTTNPIWMAFWTVTFSVVISANFALLYRLKPTLKIWLADHAQPSK